MIHRSANHFLTFFFPPNTLVLLLFTLLCQYLSKDFSPKVVLSFYQTENKSDFFSLVINHGSLAKCWSAIFKSASFFHWFQNETFFPIYLNNIDFLFHFFSPEQQTNFNWLLTKLSVSQSVACWLGYEMEMKKKKTVSLKQQL